MKLQIRRLELLATVFVLSVCAASAQTTTAREMKIDQGGTVSVLNPKGRVQVTAKPEATLVTVSAVSAAGLSDSDLKITGAGGVKVEVPETSSARRVDIEVTVPERVKLKVTTTEGEIRVSGDLESVEARTETGTIAANVPLIDLKYDFFWTASRPRYLSDVELRKVKEKAGGKFELKGRFIEGEKEDGARSEKDNDDESSGGSSEEETEEKKKKPRSSAVALNFTTARGIILLNVPPEEVTSDLRPRPLTNAAKAIVRSGDLVLTDAIRRASPKHFGEYARTLPPARMEPLMAERSGRKEIAGDTIKEAVVRVSDIDNRSIGELRASDFAVTEAGAAREVLDVRPHTAPVNLVLLLDVSGSVENYVNFIRKAARAFIETARDDDRISLILFNDDVKMLSGFSTNKQRLSDSLDTFDAGGGTAYYDALGYTMADTLRPLRGERTAIVVLTDGDDNRSFLPFESLIGAIEESGALIYPLYVPSALIAASESNDPNKGIDPLRARYMTLSERAEGEGERLAKVSGGVYYPITQLSQIQKAYDDIVTQIRTAYTVTFRSGFAADPENRPSPRLKIRVSRPTAFVQITSVTPKP